MNIALFGFMGVGKTTVGRLVAERTGRRFVDTDSVVEAEAGMPVAEIFATRGESAFRELEREAVARASSLDDAVIALGGGTVLDTSNVSNLRRGGRMVLLTASPVEVLSRVAGDTRPLLVAPDRALRVRMLMDARRKAYYAAADLIVDTDQRTPGEVAGEIVGWFGRVGA